MAILCAWILCFILFYFIQGSTAGSYCYTHYSSSKYCTYGCCDVSYSSIYERCCYSYESSSSSGSSSYSSNYDSYYDDTDWVAVIAGSTVGGIVFLAIVITTCVCICIKMSKSPVTVVHPAPTNPGPTVVMAGAGQGQSGGGYGYPQMNQYQAGPSQGPVPPPYSGAPVTANPVDTGSKAPPPAQY